MVRIRRRFLPQRDLPSMTDYRIRHFVTHLRSRSWTSSHDRSRPSRRLARQYADSRQEITGPHHHLRDRHRRALPGGWAATWLFHIHTLHGFFNLSTWLTAIAGAAALLLAYHLVTGPSGRRVPSCRHRDLWRCRQEGHIGRVAGSGDAAHPRVLLSAAV